MTKITLHYEFKFEVRLSDVEDIIRDNSPDLIPVECEPYVGMERAIDDEAFMGLTWVSSDGVRRRVVIMSDDLFWMGLENNSLPPSLEFHGVEKRDDRTLVFTGGRLIQCGDDARPATEK